MVRQEKLHEYYLIHFPAEQGIFDIVPIDWLEYDERVNTFCCHFHDGSNEDESQLAISLVKQCKPPLPSWKLYVVDIRGYAKTYEEAELRLEKLREDPYAFSTSDDASPRKELESLKKMLKIRKKRRNDEDIDKLLTDAVKDKTESMNQDHDGSSSDSAVKNPKKSARARKRKLTENSSDSSPEKDQVVTNVGQLKGTPFPPNTEKKRMKKGASESQPLSRSSKLNDSSTTHSGGSQSVDNRGEKRRDQQRTTLNEVSTPKSSRTNDPLRRVSDGRNSFSSSQTRQSQDPVGQSELLIRQLQNLPSAVAQLRAQIVRLTETQEEIKGLLLQLTTRLMAGNEAAGTPIVGPKNLRHYRCTSLQKFKDLNTKMKNDRQFREILSQSIADKINIKETLSRTLGTILKPLITKEVLMKFTAQKVTKGKSQFIELEIWTCIMEQVRAEAHRRNAPLFKEADFVKALGKCINNCRSWGDDEQIGENALEDGDGKEMEESGDGKDMEETGDHEEEHEGDGSEESAKDN